VSIRRSAALVCFMEKAETWVNGILKTWSKTWSTDCSDIRVGKRKIGVPMLHCSHEHQWHEVKSFTVKYKFTHHYYHHHHHPAKLLLVCESSRIPTSPSILFQGSLSSVFFSPCVLLSPLLVVPIRISVFLIPTNIPLSLHNLQKFFFFTGLEQFRSQHTNKPAHTCSVKCLYLKTANVKVTAAHCF